MHWNMSGVNGTSFEQLSLKIWMNCIQIYKNFGINFHWKNVKSILIPCIRDALKSLRKRVITQDIDIIVFFNKIIKLFKCI